MHVFVIRDNTVWNQSHIRYGKHIVLRRIRTQLWIDWLHNSYFNDKIHNDGRGDNFNCLSSYVPKSTISNNGLTSSLPETIHIQRSHMINMGRDLLIPCFSHNRLYACHPICGKTWNTHTSALSVEWIQQYNVRCNKKMAKHQSDLFQKNSPPKWDYINVAKAANQTEGSKIWPIKWRHGVATTNHVHWGKVHWPVRFW